MAWKRASQSSLRRSGSLSALEHVTTVSAKRIDILLSNHNGVFRRDDFARLGQIAPPNLEQQRAARLKTASEGKSPKLAKWKRDSGARTVLVLEDDDPWLTNHFRVADALVPAEATTPDAPDEVFLVRTDHKLTWWVVCLRGPGRVAGDRMPSRESDPKELTKLTSL